MKAQIVKTCTVVCLPGSVVEITSDQLEALGGAAVSLSDEKRGQADKRTSKTDSRRV